MNARLRSAARSLVDRAVEIAVVGALAAATMDCHTAFGDEAAIPTAQLLRRLRVRR